MAWVLRPQGKGVGGRPQQGWEHVAEVEGGRGACCLMAVASPYCVSPSPLPAPTAEGDARDRKAEPGSMDT